MVQHESDQEIWKHIGHKIKNVFDSHNANLIPVNRENIDGGNRCQKFFTFDIVKKIYVDNAPQIFNRGDANGVLKIFTFVLNLMFKLSIYIYIFSFATVIFSLSINWGWFVFLILNEEKFNQWTGFYMITASVMKKLKIFLEKEFFKCEKCGNKGSWCETSLLYFEITSRGKLH